MGIVILEKIINFGICGYYNFIKRVFLKKKNIVFFLVLFNIFFIVNLFLDDFYMWNILICEVDVWVNEINFYDI